MDGVESGRYYWSLPSAPDGWMYWRRDGRVATPLSREAALRCHPIRLSGSGGRVHHVQVGATYDLQEMVLERLLVLPDWPVRRGQA